MGLPDNATLEQVFAAFDEAKKDPNKNPWHIKEAERLLIDVNPDGRANVHDLTSSHSAADITTRISGDNFYGKKKKKKKDPTDDDKIGHRRCARKAKAHSKVKDMKLTDEEKELLRQAKDENAAVSTVVVPPSGIDKVARKESSSTVSKKPTTKANTHRMNYRDTNTNETSQTSLNSYNQIVPTKESIAGPSINTADEQNMSAAIDPDLVNRGDTAPSRCLMTAFRAPSAAAKRGVEHLRSAVAATFGRSKVADAFSTADRFLSRAPNRSRATAHRGDRSSFEYPSIVTTDVSETHYNAKFNRSNHIQCKIPKIHLTDTDLSSCENIRKTQRNNEYNTDATSQDSDMAPTADTERPTCTAGEVRRHPASSWSDVHNMPTFEQTESSQKRAAIASMPRSHDAKGLVFR